MDHGVQPDHAGANDFPGILNVTPNGNEGSHLGRGEQRPGGLTMPATYFFLDANGIFDGTLNSSGFPSSGTTMVTHSSGSRPRADLQVADYFEMYNGQQESDGDVDLGSGGAILLPPIKDLLWDHLESGGWGGKRFQFICCFNRDNMGKFKFEQQQYLSGAIGRAAGRDLVDACLLQRTTLLRSGGAANSRFSV